MKAKIVVTLFALPFFAVGVWMLWSVSSSFHDAWRMQDWVPVDARLVRGGYETHSGDDSDTYEAYAEYSYTFNGQRFVGERVSLSDSGDNIGDYQVDMGRRLQRIAASGGDIVIYVDPEEPQTSIIDRNLRWGLIGFKSIFLFVFGGVGLGLLIFVWRAAPPKDPDQPEFKKSPWLLNDAWQTASIRSSSKTAMWGAWAFAAFWNLISAALPFLLYKEVVEKENYVALIGLLFPLVGIGLLVWAVRRTIEWRRFGAAPVTLDPFPGSIGGHVGGTIDLNIPFDPATRFQLTLNNLHSYVSGSGKNRSRQEEAIWQDATIAHAEQGARGTRLAFRFDVPEGLAGSDADQGDSYHVWRLNLRAELPGANIDRDYDIPVYATGARSHHLSERAVQEARDEQSLIDTESVAEVIKIRQNAAGKQLLYPTGRYVGPALGGLIVGAIFAAVGWYLIVAEGHSIFGSVFVAVGVLIGIFCLYLMLNSLEVINEAGNITAVRKLLGLPISRKQMHQNNFERFEKKSTMKTQSGGKHIIHYSIRAIDRQGNTIVVGEGFRGENEAKAAIRIIAQELGLRAPPG
ncbi:MAG: DUF3592 domain-containing protein [Gammaproteobacteria bacterium]|nr:DUF3592 domain-containing protein [Gammaproteobacteria bacterium]MBT8110945.1 DUF3592 domain-containing protein [Gammaproteobacteria bacterium]NND47378.1 DUF3592 domain-containing protein [Woeseiaceae bacterium]NNL45643.1 DUF3592 domain-containing protein [Woeseiaceae bacterium]